LQKHGLDFATASLVFDDPFALSIQDRFENNEERWQTLGVVGGIVIILVAHTMDTNADEEVIRIISARKATKNEREKYEKAIW
jgi:uncharacterized protein